MISCDHNLGAIKYFLQKSDDLIFYGFDPDPAIKVSKEYGLTQDSASDLCAVRRTEGLTIDVK
ncbi:MAG TPA: hypothetical protein VKB49_27425 [Candidatus Sulfotelmatobacter sp.]|nr:hypothetical protein [Candidatus Sulfotelmatobacter sp.]